MGDESSPQAWLARKVQVATNNMLHDSGNKLPVSECEHSLQAGTRTQPPTTAHYLGLPQQRPPVGVAIAVVMALAVPRIRLRLPVPVASRRARSLAWRLRMRTR